MTPVFTARRRAEEFAALVEADQRADARYAEFLELVGALRAVPTPQPRPEFVAALRADLMLAAHTLLVPNDDDKLALPARRPGRDRKIAAAAAGFAIVGATTSMAMAAQSALPGDALYPLKRAIENAHTGISVGDSDKGATLLANASGRLDEVSALSAEGRLEDGAAIAETLTTFAQQASEASELLLEDYAATGNKSSVAELRDFASSSLNQLVELEAVIPPEAHDELVHAMTVLTQIDAQAAQACPTCGGAPITEIPPILLADEGFSSTAQSPVSPATDFKPDRSQRGGKVVPPQGHQPASAPGTDNTLPEEGVLNPPAETEPSEPSGGTAPDEGGDDPIGSLTEGLTGGQQPTSNDQAPSLPDDLDDVLDGDVDDVTDLPNLP